MFDIEELYGIEPFSLSKDEKEREMCNALSFLTKRHYKYCPEYKLMLDAMGFQLESMEKVSDVPFLPVRLFKEYSLRSVEKENIQKTMTSSGTTGQRVSKIFLDKYTSTNQTKTLSKIMTSYLGKKRLPMLIIDSSAVLKDRNMFSARGAGILGFSMYGYDQTYALDENMQLRTDEIKKFLNKHKDEQILMFGFTFMIWQHFCQKMIEEHLEFDFSKGILIHGGGWKKLAEQAVSNNVFKKTLATSCGVKKVYNYYGMVEQTGSIYMECEQGHLHSSIYSDIIIRRSKDFSVADIGEDGIVQVVSVLPYSYPGHSLLTEDDGVLLGEDDCPCGRKGKYFNIHGRLKNAEIRGCSDTYAAKIK